MPHIEVCASLRLASLHDLSKKVVVIVDILRATSCISMGIDIGVKSIVPVAKVEECTPFIKRGFIPCGERNGKKIDGFKMGNSPYEFMNRNIIGQNIVMTTTNGTSAIKLAKKAEKILIASFLNFDAVADYLLSLQNNILILCAGWKGNINVEDMLFAGALSEKLSTHFDIYSDTALLSLWTYSVAKTKLYQYISESAHARRLKESKLYPRDIIICTQINRCKSVPILQNEGIIKLTESS